MQEIYTTCTPSGASSTICTTVQPLFGAGESVIILLLIMVYIHLFFTGLKDWLYGTRIENTLIKSTYQK